VVESQVMKLTHFRSSRPKTMRIEAPAEPLPVAITSAVRDDGDE
jgi:hypothetical protein